VAVGDSGSNHLRSSCAMRVSSCHSLGVAYRVTRRQQLGLMKENIVLVSINSAELAT